MDGIGQVSASFSKFQQNFLSVRIGSTIEYVAVVVVRGCSAYRFVFFFVVRSV